MSALLQDEFQEGAGVRILVPDVLPDDELSAYMSLRVENMKTKVFWFAVPVLMFLLAGVLFIENLDRFSANYKMTKNRYKGRIFLRKSCHQLLMVYDHDTFPS